MNGEYRLDFGIAHHFTVNFLQIHADRACLPVVTVDDIGIKVQHRQHIQHSLAVKPKAFVVIAMAVHAAAPKIIVVFNEIDRYVSFFYQNLRRLHPPLQMDVKLSQKLHAVHRFIFDRQISGNHNAHVYPFCPQRLWQGTDDIA